LPTDVAPGRAVRVLATVQAPSEPGRYRLRWDLVRENVTWFSERGNATADQSVDVERVAAGTRPRRSSSIVDSTLEDLVASYSPSRPELWRAALGLWATHPIWGVGPDNFRRVYPQALALRPKDPDATFDQRIHANSLYFETLADLGLAGLVALTLLMIALARTAWRSVSRPVVAASAALAIAVGTFFIHGLLDWFLEFTPTYALYWLLIALLAAGMDNRGPAAPNRA
jgi:O-antigen ligase